MLAACLVALTLLSQTSSPTPDPASTPAPALTREQRSFAVDGRSVVVDVLIAGDDTASATAAFVEVERVLALFASGAADGAFARVHAAAGSDAVVVDPEIYDVLATAQRVAKLSKGAYDPTSGAYAALWSFAGDKAPPSKADVDRLRPLVGLDQLVLDPVKRTAKLKSKAARLDVDSVVVAHALHSARAALLARNVVDFVVSSGGDVVGNGKKSPSTGTPWMVGVQDPRGVGPFLTVPLDTVSLGGAVMTTSDNDRFVVVDGKRVHDVLDPRTGQPAQKCKSATVFFADPLVADALSRALFVLGDKEGLKLVDRLPGAHAVVVTADNRVVLSKGLQKLAKGGVLLHRPVTDG